MFGKGHGLLRPIWARQTHPSHPRELSPDQVSIKSQFFTGDSCGLLSTCPSTAILSALRVAVSGTAPASSSTLLLLMG
eukprot:1366258-Alexandrium_andersonii.AAC.1